MILQAILIFCESILMSHCKLVASQFHIYQGHNENKESCFTEKPNQIFKKYSYHSLQIPRLMNEALSLCKHSAVYYTTGS